MSDNKVEMIGDRVTPSFLVARAMTKLDEIEGIIMVIKHKDGLHIEVSISDMEFPMVTYLKANLDHIIADIIAGNA